MLCLKHSALTAVVGAVFSREGFMILSRQGCRSYIFISSFGTEAHSFFVLNLAPLTTFVGADFSCEGFMILSRQGCRSYILSAHSGLKPIHSLS